MDDKLKKGEIKITVVATGFNNGHLVGTRPGLAAVAPRPNLFDNASDPRKMMANGQNGNGSASHKEIKEFVDSSVNEEEFDIPAFIRRKMK